MSGLTAPLVAKGGASDIIAAGQFPFTPGSIPFANSAGLLTQETQSASNGFSWDETNNGLIIGISVAARPTNGLLVYGDSGAGTSIYYTVEQDGVGDVIAQWLLTATQAWVAGVDNSDSDKWKLAPNNNGFTTTIALTADTAGQIGIGRQDPAVMLDIQRNDATTNTVGLISRYSKMTSGTAAAGFGAGISYLLENGSGTEITAMEIDWLWTVATAAAESADVVINLRNAGASVAEKFRFTSQGFMKWLGQKRVTTQFDTTSTTLADVTGLGATVAAGKSYYFEAKLYTTSNVGGGVKAAIAGSATATAITYEGLTISGGTITQTRAAAMGTAVGAITAVTAAYITISGTITVNAAGTLIPQLAANIAVGTTSALVGSTFIVNEIT